MRRGGAGRGDGDADGQMTGALTPASPPRAARRDRQASCSMSRRTCVVSHDETVKSGRAAISSAAVARASSIRPACSCSMTMSARPKPGLARMIGAEGGERLVAAAGEAIGVAELAEIVRRIVRAQRHRLLDQRDRLRRAAGSTAGRSSRRPARRAGWGQARPPCATAAMAPSKSLRMSRMPPIVRCASGFSGSIASARST